jgi:hypothetical protein
VKCWGYSRYNVNSNQTGSLGDGTFKNRKRAVTVKNLLDPPATYGQDATAETVSGTVLIKAKRSPIFVPLTTATKIPIGSSIDTTNGVIKLTTASGKGKLQTGRFSEGVFKLTQHREPSKRKGGGKLGFTDLTLQGGEPVDCAAGAGSIVLAKSRKKRHLWGDGHGNYKTNGQYASGSVRGTKWLTEDSCEGTRITVARGIVSVTDMVKRKTVLVKSGHSYLARAPKS